MTQLCIPAYDDVFAAAVMASAARQGAVVKCVDMPGTSPDRGIEIGVNWIPGDLVDTSWTLSIWRTPHWSEGRDLEVVKISKAAHHNPGGSPTISRTGLSAIDRMLATVAQLQSADRRILAAGGTTERPPLWAFRMHRTALDLVRHEKFDIDGMRRHGSDTYRNPESSTLYTTENDEGAKVSMWSRRLVVNVHELKTADRKLIFRTHHARLRNVLTIRHHVVPDTILSAMSGRGIGEVVAHPSWGDDAGMRITSARREDGGPDGKSVLLALSNEMVGLESLPEGVEAW